MFPRALFLLIFFLFAQTVLAEEYEGEIRFELKDLSFSKQSGFDQVHLKDCDLIQWAGAPGLPRKRINVAIPMGARIRSVRAQAMEVIRLKGQWNIQPNPEAIRLQDKAPEFPYQKDQDLYSRNRLFPGAYCEKVSEWDFAWQEFVTINLFPLQYNPVTRQLTLVQRMGFVVEYERGSSLKPRANLSAKTRTRFEKILKDRAFNPDCLAQPQAHGPSWGSALAPGSYEFVIITSSFFKNSMKPLVEWRNAMGFPTVVKSLFEIYLNYPGANSQEKIRNFIIDAYHTWGAVYFLLGGDTAIVPYHMRHINGEDIPNDTYYSDFDDDWVCEAAVGRACFKTPSQADLFVSKVLTYEKNPPSDYGDTVLFLGFDLDSSTQSEKCKISIKKLWVPSYADFEREFDSEPGGHLDDVVAYMNAGKNLINHIDHCGTGYIGIACVNHGRGFDNNAAASFTNGQRYSNFYTLGCWAGNYPDHCWGEAFTLDDQGGITFVGNSRYGWYHPGTYTTLSHKYEKKWWKALYDSNAYRAGDTLAESKNLYYPPDSGYQYIFTELNLLGDPTLHLWTKDPKDLEVDCYPYLTTGAQTLTVSVSSTAAFVNQALVCAQKDNEVYAYGITDTSGQVQLSIEPLTPGDIVLTVTAQNFRFCEKAVAVGDSPEIESVEPACGPESGGSLITIWGDKFVQDAKVKVDGADCDSITVIDPNTLTCITPMGVDGWRDVEVFCGSAQGILKEGFRFFPTHQDPFNGMDIKTQSLTCPVNGTIISSGWPHKSFGLFYSYGGGPILTPYGTMGLDLPFHLLFVSVLNSEGYALIPVTLPMGFGPMELFIHVLGETSQGPLKWSSGGQNPNGSGSIRINLLN